MSATHITDTIYGNCIRAIRTCDLSNMNDKQIHSKNTQITTDSSESKNNYRLSAERKPENEQQKYHQNDNMSLLNLNTDYIIVFNNFAEQ